MQELLLSLWKDLPAYRSESRVSTLAYRVMHNAALSWHRGRHRRLIKTLPEPEAVPESIEGTSHQPTPLTFVPPKNYRDWLAAEHAACGLVDLPNAGGWRLKICHFESCLRSACMELPSLASGATPSGTPAWKSRTSNRYFAITMDLKNQIRTTRPETWRETNGKESRN